MCWFTTFNSLSRDHDNRHGGRGPKGEGAFNSLSRDHLALASRLNLDKDFSFNSLSRDHRVSIVAVGGKYVLVELSTPSLGITEPDSGIFRLSAAFCRGTPSHK